MLNPITLLPLLSLITLSALAGPSHHKRATVEDPHPHPHNRYHPHRDLLARSITADATTANAKSFDFIIAGGGCAGLSLAARLSEWSNVTVLLIEAGGDGSDVEDQIDIPGYSYLNSLGGSKYDWQYKTAAQVDALDTIKTWPRGKGLGGSGAINGLFFGRASSQEYDAWETLNPDGTEKWGWDEMSKYINKAETFTEPPQGIQSYYGMVFNASTHGTIGPIQAGFSEYIFDGVKNWIPAWVNLGMKARDLWEGSTNGAMFSASTINTSNQTRSDSKAGYIDPLPPRSNLVILTGQQVTQVVFNGSTDASGNIIASGVKFQAAAGATSYTVTANKEVILAGGTVGSPQILQLSGVGPKDTLTALGISSKLDLPVGYNLQDHVSYTMYWNTPANTLTWATLANSADLKSQQLEIYRQNKTGMWTYVNEAVGYTAMSDMMSSAEVSSYASSVQSALATQVSQVSSWQNLPSTVASGLADQYAIQQKWLTTDVGQLEIILTMLGQNLAANQVGIQVALQHPWSRGNILINSTDPFTPPDINPDYFGVGYDIDIMGYGSTFARKLAGTSPLSNLMVTESSPGAAIVDDALGNYTKTNSGTEYHPLGTCSMMPQSKGGVVDTNLLVYGAANLRVIDASIMPLQLSAHLMASTYGIAEKGADIIKKKYWLVQPTTSTSSSSHAQSTTATAGTASDTAVKENNPNSNTSTSGLSSGAKIGVGVGAGLGALAVLAALLAFCLVRRKRRAPANEKGWYQPPSAHDEDPSGAYKEAANGGHAYPMAAFAAPNAPFGSHSRSESTSTMATAELASRAPMRSESGYDMGDYARGGDSSPYRDASPAPQQDDGTWPREQRYRQVQL